MILISRDITFDESRYPYDEREKSKPIEPNIYNQSLHDFAVVSSHEPNGHCVGAPATCEDQLGNDVAPDNSHEVETGTVDNRADVEQVSDTRAIGCQVRGDAENAIS